MPNYKYNGEYNPVILHDLKGPDGYGVGMVVYTNQVISVDQTYIGSLNHSVFSPSDEKISTAEEIELLKPLMRVKKDQADMNLKMESIERLLKEKSELEILNKTMTKNMNAMEKKMDAMAKKLEAMAKK